MRRFTAIRLTVMAAVCAAAAGLAVAAARAQPAEALEGRPVLAADGRVLGRVERVIRAPDGRPLQVLVRPAGIPAAGPRSLSADALEVTPQGVRAPLTRAEFNAMPPVAPTGKTAR